MFAGVNLFSLEVEKRFVPVFLYASFIVDMEEKLTSE